jgi:hypothetical protein
MSKIKDLETTVTNQNTIHEEIKISLSTGNVCYNSVQNLPSFCNLSKNLKINKTVILPAVLYGREMSLSR